MKNAINFKMSKYKQLLFRMLAIICAFAVFTAGWGDALAFAVEEFFLTKNIVASDGKTYTITVRYDGEAELPKGVKLEATELIDEDAQDYIDYTSKLLKTGSVNYGRVFDIAIVDENGNHCQPAGNVSVKIELSDLPEIPSTLDVVHFPDSVAVKEAVDVSSISAKPENALGSEEPTVEAISAKPETSPAPEAEASEAETDAEEAEILESSYDNGIIEFETSGFSVYVVVEHEGGVVKNPRVEFHFIDRYTDAQYEAGIVVTEPTTASPYNFAVDAAQGGGYQASQILADGETVSGETLELINDPSNISISGAEKFFYGWAVVDMISDSSVLDTDTSSATYGRYTGSISFKWPENPSQIRFEQPISITANDVNGDGKITVPDEDPETADDTLTWSLGDVTGTAAIDETGTAHVYLAPLYEDFYFVNFHSGPRTSDPSTSSNLMVRKLVIFGSASSTSVRIGNVMCESPDPQHKIFSGWEEDMDGDNVYTFYQTVEHVIDGEGNLTNKEVDSSTGSNGYYITVSKGTEKVSYLDLYPRFDEARWLYFNTGKSGNGATYVGAAFRLTNDEREASDNSDYYYFDNDFFTGGSGTLKHLSSRPGYTFGGWYLFANADSTTGELTNLDTAEDVAVKYLTTDNVAMDSSINTKAIPVVDGSGNIIQSVGTWYVATDGTVSQTAAEGSRKLFEVDSEGNLRFYRAMNDMTLYARWIPKTVTYTILYWAQNADDDDYTLVDYKTPNAVAGDTTEVDPSQSAYAPAADKLEIDYFHLSDDQDKDTAGNQSGIQQKTVEGDGTTQINVYYDRNIYTLWFYLGRATGGTLTNTVGKYDHTKTYPVTQYTDINGDTFWAYTDANNGSPYGTVGTAKVPLTVTGTINVNYYKPQYSYSSTTNNAENGLYGIVDGEYVELEGTASTVAGPTYYVLTSTLSGGNDYLIVSRNSSGSGYALGHSDTTVERDAVTVNSGIVATNNTIYIASDDVDSTSVWTAIASGTYFIFQNDGYYIRNNNNNLQISSTNDNNTWGYSNSRLRVNGNGRNIRYNNSSWSISNTSSNVYLYVKTSTTTTTWSYKIKGSETPYTGTVRYTQSGYTGSSTYTASQLTEYGGTYYYTDGNGGKVPCAVDHTETSAAYSYKDSNGDIQSYPAGGSVIMLVAEDNPEDVSVVSYSGGTYSVSTSSSSYNYTGNSNYANLSVSSFPWEGFANRASTNGSYTYFYYSLTAKYGADITDKWPDYDFMAGYGVESAGGYDFTSWIPNNNSLHTYVYTGARNGDGAANIKGKYYKMSADIISIWNGSSYTVISDNEATGGSVSGSTVSNVAHILQGRYSSNANKYVYYIYLGNGDGTYKEPSLENGTKVYTFSQGGVTNQTIAKYTGYNDGTRASATEGTETYGGMTWNILKFYYEPHTGTVTVYQHHPTEGNTEIKAATTYYYGQSLSDAVDGITPPEINGYTFKGWYDNQDGIGSPFDFSSETMPDNGIINIYAIYSPVVYLIKIDPNGGEIDHINHAGYTGFGTGSVTIDSNAYTYDFTGIDADYVTFSNYPITGAGTYNRSQATYVNDLAHNDTLSEYSVPRRFVAMSDRVAAEYKAQGNAVYYYVNYQWKSTDGVAGIYSDVKNALYLTETELEHFYQLYRNIIIYSKGLFPAANTGMELLEFDDWKQLYVEDTPYRPTNSNETWVLLGWYKTGPDGIEETVPYNFDDPVTESFTLTAHWRLNGGYSISYVPQYTMPDGAEINGEMSAWRDPIDSGMSYANGADTEIYKAPTGLTKDGVRITDDSVIFRGWALVSRSGAGTDSDPYVYKPLEVDSSGEITTYYLPSDAYEVYSSNASVDSVIYFQAVYQYKESSDRLPKVTNLTLDANTGYINTSDSGDLPKWSTQGVQAINTEDNLTSDGDPTQILFGDIQSNAGVRLYRYTSEIEQNSAGKTITDSHQFFEHKKGYFLLGFDDSSTEGDYIATYPADSIISVQRNEDKTIYAVWEPMVYVTFENKTGVTESNVVFSLSSSDSEALEVINVKNGMYDREPLDNYSSISLANGESITLAFPKGAERTLVITGTNNLGVGKKLVWNSSLDLVERSGNTTTTTSYTTVGAATETVSYSHTVDDSTHSHALVSGSVNNTQAFSFNESLIANENPLTVVFSKVDNEYAILLDDNYSGGGMQEIDYALADIQPENGVPKQQVLPITSTRTGCTFLGWATTANATSAEYSSSLPPDNPWTILDLNRDDGFFSENTVTVGETITRTLYAVWEAKTDAVYIYKEVPEPGNKDQGFTFTLNIDGYYYMTDGATPIAVNKTHDFRLKDEEYLRINSSNANPTSGENQTAFVQAVVQVYSPVTDSNGITTDIEDTSRSYTVRWEANVTGKTTNRFAGDVSGNGQLIISVTEAAVTYYDTSITLSAESEDDVLTIGSSTFDISDLTPDPQTVDASVVSWVKADAGTGGTIVFVNQRQKYDVEVSKTLISNTSAAKQFDFTASYTDTYTDINGSELTDTTQLDDLIVFSSSSVTLQDVPAGVKLTVTEKTDANNNYETYVSVDGAAETEGKAASEFTVGAGDYVAANGQHLLAFRNVLKSFDVTFMLVDQDLDTTINGTFSLESSAGSLGSSLYANHLSTNPPAGVFYPRPETAEPKLWADDYTLSQITYTSKYLKLPGNVTISVTGNGVTSSDNENIVIEGDAENGYVVKVINRKTVNIHLDAALLDPMYNQRNFVFSGTYVLNGKTYDLGRNLLTGGAAAATYSITAYSTSDGSVSTSSSYEGRVFTIPVGATGLTFTEDVSRVTVSPDTIATTYDTSTGYVTGTEDEVRNASNTYTYAAAVTDSNEGDTVTFYNNKKTVSITVKKTVTLADTAGTFSFEATLLNGNNPIKGYPIFINASPLDTSDDYYTDASTGTYEFTLTHDSTYVLTVPVGAKLTVQETGVTGAPDGMTLDSYGTAVETVLTITAGHYSGTTGFDETSKLYTLNAAPSSALTVKFTNGENGVAVRFEKIDGFGVAQAGAVFRLYTNAACTSALEISGAAVTATSSDGTAKDSSDNTLPTGTVLFEKIPDGVYYMKEITVPAGYTNANKYMVFVGSAESDVYAAYGLAESNVSAQTAAYKLNYGDDYDKYAIFMIDPDSSKAVTVPDIAAYGIMNISTTTRKTVLKKLNNSYSLLSGAGFEILRYDRTLVATGTSGTNGAFFVDDLPYGTYYLHETAVPDGYTALAGSEDNWYILTVNEKGAGAKRADESVIRSVVPQSVKP